MKFSQNPANYWKSTPCYPNSNFKWYKIHMICHPSAYRDLSCYGQAWRCSWFHQWGFPLERTRKQARGAKLGKERENAIELKIPMCKHSNNEDSDNLKHAAMVVTDGGGGGGWWRWTANDNNEQLSQIGEKHVGKRKWEKKCREKNIPKVYVSEDKGNITK